MATQHCFETDDDAIAAYVAQLLNVTGTIAAIVNHMAWCAASERSAPDAPPVTEVLSELLRGVLEQLARDHPRAAIESCATILAKSLDIVCDEIFLVPLEGAGAPRPPGAPRPSRAVRRAARRPRPRRR